MIQIVDGFMVINCHVFAMWWNANWGWFAALAGIILVDYINWRRTHKIVRIK